MCADLRNLVKKAVIPLPRMLMEEIERIRAEMHELALLRGLSDPLVLQKSQQLDELINQYFKLIRKKTIV